MSFFLNIFADSPVTNVLAQAQPTPASNNNISKDIDEHIKKMQQEVAKNIVGRLGVFASPSREGRLVRSVFVDEKDDAQAQQMMHRMIKSYEDRIGVVSDKKEQPKYDTKMFEVLAQGSCKGAKLVEGLKAMQEAGTIFQGLLMVQLVHQKGQTHVPMQGIPDGDQKTILDMTQKAFVAYNHRMKMLMGNVHYQMAQNLDVLAQSTREGECARSVFVVPEDDGDAQRKMNVIVKGLKERAAAMVPITNAEQEKCDAKVLHIMSELACDDASMLECVQAQQMAEQIETSLEILQQSDEAGAMFRGLISHKPEEQKAIYCVAKKAFRAFKERKMMLTYEIAERTRKAAREKAAQDAKEARQKAEQDKKDGIVRDPTHPQPTL